MVGLKPKLWNLQPKIFFSSQIECRLVPSPNMTRSTLKRSEIMGLGQWGKEKIKIFIGCLAWQQIKAVDSLNHLKLFTNHNCLTKWSYLLKGSTLRSEKSNGSQKIMLVGDVEGPYGRLPQDFLKSTFSIDFYALPDETCCQKQIKGDIVKIAISKWRPWKNAEKWTMGIYVNFNHHR